MERYELRIGTWVNAVIGNNSVRCRVNGIKRIGKSYHALVFGSWVDVGMLAPVTLTREMLLDNNFIVTRAEEGEYMRTPGGEIELLVRENASGEPLIDLVKTHTVRTRDGGSVKMNYFIARMRHVHKLQDAMLVCESGKDFNIK